MDGYVFIRYDDDIPLIGGIIFDTTGCISIYKPSMDAYSRLTYVGGQRYRRVDDYLGLDVSILEGMYWTPGLSWKYCYGSLEVHNPFENGEECQECKERCPKCKRKGDFIEGIDMCNVCALNFDLRRCISCDNIDSQDRFLSWPGPPVCNSCYDDGSFYVDSCVRCDSYLFDYGANAGSIPEEERGYWSHIQPPIYINQDDADEWDELEGPYCEACSHRITRMSGPIHGYGYNPAPKFFNSKSDFASVPKRKQALYIGMELEVECINENPGVEAARLLKKDIRKYVYLKSDGSLSSGYEIVSYPLSFYMWMHDFPWQNIGDLRDTHRSNKTDTCGAHLHLSRDAFGNYHLYKFIRFHYDNVDAITVIAQRGGNGYAYWDKPGDRALKKMSKEKSSDLDRYHAVNLSVYEKNTIELRYFKGNLRPERLKKNIQFVHAVYGYTQSTPLKDLTWEGLLVFLDKNKSMYPELISFIYEKKLNKYVTSKSDRRQAETIVKDLFNDLGAATS